jgi:MFS family permease
MTASTAATLRKPMTNLQQALLSFFWLATNIHWTTILVVTMPSQIRDAVGNDVKGTYLGIALAIGALISMVAAPAFGALSDRIKLPGGRRKPWVVIGTLGNILGLFGLAYFIQPGNANSLLPWTIAFLWVELFNNVATAPYSALIPDLVPPEQRGAASGWLGLMIVLGNLFGALLGFFIQALGGVVGIYYVLMLVMLIGAVVTWFGVKEPTTFEVKSFHWKEFFRGLYDPFKSSDFTWVFMTRLLVTMGIFTVQEFLQYYLGDVIGAPFKIAGIGQVADSPEQAVSLFLGPMLVGGVISTLVAGVLSDKRGRKFIVYISGALMGLVALMFVFFHDFTLAVVMGIVFGLGYGAYESVDWAMASDVLPSMDDYAKDMGVWHVAMVLPQVVATPIAGFLLDNFQAVGRTSNIPNLGYTVIFLLSVVYFVLGTVFVKQIKKVR